MFYTYYADWLYCSYGPSMAMPTNHNTDKIPNQDENYILVAPHRTWWDPVYMAFATKPKQFIFMAKKRTLYQPYLWLVDSYVWRLSYRPGKS